MRILLIEDDAIIGDGLVVALTKQGMTIDWLQDGEHAKHALQQNIHDLIILDLTLPKIDGLDLLALWRNNGHTTPILILTARDSIDQKVKGLNLGADDYLAKPFSLAELIARIHALLRRHKGQSKPLLSHGAVTFNPQTRKVYFQEKEVSLSPKALTLLEIFLLHKDTILSRSLLEEKLYGWNEEISSNTIEVHIHALRSKLGNHFIKTAHGIGYKLGNIDDI